MATSTIQTRWPPLPLSEWKDTRDTLHLWTQVIGEVRMANEALLNHWWSIPLYVTARGLTTSLTPHPSGDSFQVDLDFEKQQLEIVTMSGAQRSMTLRSGRVSDFYARFMSDLDEMGVATEIWPVPVEIEDAIPFDDDHLVRTCNPEHAYRFWIALVQVVRVFQQFRSRFIGKTSPVHLFWGALDLASSRFSGRPAPPHPGGAPNCGPHVMREAYSHEVSSCGYWLGGGGEGLFYSYVYPEPASFRRAGVAPEGAFYSEELSEFVLPYESVRTAADPDGVLLEFLQTGYEAAATASNWDRKALERPKGVINAGS
jgi:hypothetical protein